MSYATRSQRGRLIAGAQEGAQNIVPGHFGGYAATNGPSGANYMSLHGPPILHRFLNTTTAFGAHTIMVCCTLNNVTTASTYLCSVADFSGSSIYSLIGKLSASTTQFWTINSKDTAGVNRASAVVVTGGILAGIPYCIIGKETLGTRYGYVNGPNDSVLSYINTGSMAGYIASRGAIGRLDRASSPVNAVANTYFSAFAFWLRALSDAEMRIVSADPMVLFRKNPAREFAFRPNIRGISDYLKRKHSANA